MVGYDLRRLRPTDDEPLFPRFERLRQEAVSEGKRVAVLFSADWCEPCRRLDIELGNLHPEALIGDVRVLELKEEEWVAATRMDEFRALYGRWSRVLNRYPLFVLLDEDGRMREEMTGAIDRLETMGVEPTLSAWFESTRRSAP
jgi:thiol-disulfide isomerase/thioredoxin